MSRSMARVAVAVKEPPTVLYHACTTKQRATYVKSGAILPPVRGFDTLEASMVWASAHGREHVVAVAAPDAQALPDHHHQLGLAWFTPHLGFLLDGTGWDVPKDFHVTGLRAIRAERKGDE